MNDAQLNPTSSVDERRVYPRYDVPSRFSLAVEDESLGETIGIGEAVDISLGGLRLSHLPARSNVRLGDMLGLLLIGEENALPLRGEVVHHGTEDTYGIKFAELTATDERRMSNLLQRLH
ncbi:MAG: PilZ domain-containing protein [Pyrinomonadaceae bacterium]